MEVDLSSSEEEYELESLETVKLNDALRTSVKGTITRKTSGATILSTRRPSPVDSNMSAESTHSSSSYFHRKDSLSRQSNEDHESIDFKGVKVGTKYNYGDQIAIFEYNEKEIDVYLQRDPREKIFFEEFVIHPEGASNSPFQFFDPLLIENLKKQNIFEMRPIQLATMQACFFAWPIDNEAPDFCGTAVTGHGKSLGFLLPLIQKCINRNNLDPGVSQEPLGLVFAHSKPLVDDLFQKALQLAQGTGVIIKQISGGNAFLKDSDFDIGICTIGRFKNHFGSTRGDRDVEISLEQLKYLVIDEADKMAEDDDFVSIFDQIKVTRSDISTMLFTATFDTTVARFLNVSNRYCFGCGKINSVAPSVRMIGWEVDSLTTSGIYGTLKGEFRYVPSKGLPHPFDALYVFLKKHFINSKRADGKPKKAIVFVKRMAIADLIARKLTHYDIPAVSVHSKYSRELQQKRLNTFILGEVRVLIATNQLTRGTDIEIEYVINYDLPLDYKDFIHRCGRTGRNGNKGTAITFYDFNNEDDYSKKVLQKIVLNNRIRSPKPSLKEFTKGAIKIREMDIQMREAFLSRRPHF